MTEWRPVIGFEATHEVSDDGDVRTLNGKILCQRGFPYLKYNIVTLCVDGRKFIKRVHKLVAEAFLGTCPQGQEVLHGPAGRYVNCVTNLSYGTRKQNVADMKRDNIAPIGSRHGSAVLSEETVLECRERYARGGVTQDSLAKEFNVSRTTMRDAINGKYWRHV